MPESRNNRSGTIDDICGNTMEAGNDLMVRGGAHGDINDECRIILKLRKPMDKKNRFRVYERELFLTYYPVVDGSVINECITNNLRISDYDGKRLFRKGVPVSFLGVYEGMFSIAVPVTVRLSDESDLRGTIDITFICDSNRLNDLISNMNGRFIRNYNYGFENIREISARNVCEIIGGNISECVSEIMRYFDAPQMNHNTICSKVFSKIDADVGISGKGFRVERLCVNFDRSHDERLKQLASEARFRIDRERIGVEETKYMMELTREEYRAVRDV